MTNCVLTMKELYRYLIITATMMFLGFPLIGQQLTVNTQKIESLIGQWNSIHNNANIEGFENIYDDHLLFYSEHVNRSKATLLKKLLFVRNPGYRQRIGTEIKYTLYTNGVVKCEFTKEVLRNTGWDPEPMYLLVGYKNRGYWIIGESDPRTDQQYGYVGKIGEALDVEILSASKNSENSTFLSEMAANTSLNSTSRGNESISYGNLHIFLVIALLSAGILIIFLDQMGVRKEKELQAQQQEEAMLEDDYDIVTIEPKMPNEAYQVIENSLKQKAFRGYLLKLFDPVFFVLKKSEEEASPAAGQSPDADFKLEFEIKDRRSGISDIWVRYLYTEDSGNELRILPDQFLSTEDPQRLGYYVIGVGGPPHMPNELYLIPSAQMNKSAVTKEDLKPFRRFGSFYFDPTAGKLA